MAPTHDKAEAILNEFLSELTTFSKERGYEFLPHKFIPEETELQKLQLYWLKNPNTGKQCFLFVHVSNLRRGFWGISSRWQEIFRKLSSENFDYVIMLLKGAANRGFLLTSKDFEMLKPMFSVSHDTQILIEEKNLPFLSKFEFFGWKRFSQLLNI